MMPVKISKHETYKGMHWVVYDDGVKWGFYNKTRALDIVRNYDSYCNEQDKVGRAKRMASANGFKAH